MKKILILGDANSSHTVKWAMGVASRGYTVKIFSLTSYPANALKDSSIEVYSSSFAGKTKFFYPLAIIKLLLLIRNFKPDIVHAHYASSYGLLGALSGFHRAVFDCRSPTYFRSSPPWRDRRRYF